MNTRLRSRRSFLQDLALGVMIAIGTSGKPFLGKEWYHPGNWRKRLDFGTGTFGDMGCHIYDPVFAALALTGALSERPGYTKTSSSSRTCSSSSSSVCSGAKRSALKPRSMPWSLMLPMISMR